MAVSYPHFLRKLLTIVAGILVFLYPLIIYSGFKLNIIHILLPFIAVIFVIRLLLVRKKFRVMALQSMLIALCAVVLVSLSSILKSLSLALYYPVCTNVILFIFFIGSYFSKESIITTLARLKDKDLPDAAIIYTRKVTLIWALFFILNGSMALFTVVYGSLELWTLYNGLIAYILIGLLFLGEYIVRIRKQGEYR